MRLGELSLLGTFVAVLLAGCAGGQNSLSDSPEAAQTASAGMPGRWMLAAPNAPPCGMNFMGADGAREGRVSPDGGCPGRFFLSRRWSLSNGVLTILDPDGEALAELKAANGGYAGKATVGISVTLTRAAAPAS